MAILPNSSNLQPHASSSYATFLNDVLIILKSSFYRQTYRLCGHYHVYYGTMIWHNMGGCILFIMKISSKIDAPKSTSFIKRSTLYAGKISSQFFFRPFRPLSCGRILNWENSININLRIMYETWLEGESASDLHRAKIRLGEFKTIYSSFTLTECTGKYQEQKFYKIIFLIKDAWSSVEGYLKVKKCQIR